ncbi:hypothetical protein PZH32_13120 [Adlercreutzia equolifaciens]|nr:hypothetical protein [Adlercreutzia equolifaciens]MDE8703891.1 hypothetical protein [Adlercreutzia equolifaciens]
MVYITQDVTALKRREKQMQQAMEDSYRAAHVQELLQAVEQVTTAS